MPHRDGATLIIDDDEAVRRTCVEMLRARGHQTLAAASVGEGLRLFGERHPAAVLLDLKLPDGAGIDVLRELQRQSPGTPGVVISGESGTGKELIAHAIHARSPRREHPFIELNCAAIPGELIESEMFGHVKGSFTGAVTDRKGRFETAHGGTLFLDEIGDMSLMTQAKLLRVLQEGVVTPVGSSETRPVDVRILCATSK